ncbi:MAG: 2-C-methyl-D-erythritol 4-phosphate cytidylyltransferase [Leucothrix sp.]
MFDYQQQGFWVVIPASGVGSRMQADLPKQYISLHGKTVLEHTIDRFAGLQGLAGILVVVSEADTFWPNIQQRLLSRYQSQGFSLLSTLGGNERSDTVINGLSFLLNEVGVKPDIRVMVHDAARPCVREADILKLLTLALAETEVGAILATPVKDTLKLADAHNETIDCTQSRVNVWQAQTPQLFRLGMLLESLLDAQMAGVPITDEASAMEYKQHPVRLVEGASDNIKLTTPADLTIINFLLGADDHNGL